MSSAELFAREDGDVIFFAGLGTLSANFSRASACPFHLKQLFQACNDLSDSVRLSVRDHMPAFVDNVQNRLPDHLV
jgi:hypothetical protein